MVKAACKSWLCTCQGQEPVPERDSAGTRGRDQLERWRAARSGGRRHLLPAPARTPGCLLQDREHPGQLRGRVPVTPRPDPRFRGRGSARGRVSAALTGLQIPPSPDPPAALLRAGITRRASWGPAASRGPARGLGPFSSPNPSCPLHLPSVGSQPQEAAPVASCSEPLAPEPPTLSSPSPTPSCRPNGLQRAKWRGWEL